MNVGYCYPELSYPVQLCTSIKGAFDALGILLYVSHCTHTYKQYVNSIYLYATQIHLYLRKYNFIM